MSRTGITADAQTLLAQASMTAGTYLGEAVVRIDREFGEGYAANHPELVAAFMKVAASDFHTAQTNQIIGGAIYELAEAVERYTSE